MHSVFDSIREAAYFFDMEKPKSSCYDIGVYLFYVLVVGGVFAALWQTTDFFTAVAAVQFFGPIIIILSAGPSMLFGEMFAAVARVCRRLFKPKEPPHAPIHGEPIHTAI